MLGIGTRGKVLTSTGSAPTWTVPVGCNVRDYGALGDGSTGDTAAFAAALAAAGRHGTILVPPGTYLINLDLGNSHPIIQGAGTDATILRGYTAGDAPLTFGYDNGGGGWQWGEVRDLQISGTPGTRTHF